MADCTEYGLVNFCYQKNPAKPYKTQKDLSKKSLWTGSGNGDMLRAGRKEAQLGGVCQGFLRDWQGSYFQFQKNKMGVVSFALPKAELHLVSCLVLRMQDLSDFMACVRESLARRLYTKCSTHCQARKWVLQDIS